MITIIHPADITTPGRPMSATVMRTVDVAARWRCSERHVRALISTGQLPAFRLGGKLLRVPIAAIEAFEQCQTIQGSFGTKANSRSCGTTSAAVIALRLARSIEPKPTVGSLSS